MNQHGSVFLRVLTAMVALTFCAALPAVAHWDEGGPFKIHWPQLPDESPEGIDVNATEPFELADDFQCTMDGAITSIHIWGSWLSDRMDDDTVFRLAIYKDLPPDASNPAFHPGEELWSAIFDPSQYAVRVWRDGVEEGWMDPPQEYIPPPADTVIWQYNFTIDPREAFVQTDGEIYWLGVSSMSPAGERFGWKTTRPEMRHREDAHWHQLGNPWEELFYVPPHQMAGESIDLSFVIDGEPVQPDDTDFGDAPAPYPTTLPTGARHTIVPGFFLGGLIDAELDGQPHPNALGDDNAGQPDEDGVLLLSPLMPGHPAQIEVIASAPGMLDAWFDFGADGTWDEPGDRIFTSEPLSTGMNPLTFTVHPATASGTPTFARFRYSTVGGLPPEGPATDGEVEDYQFAVEGDPDIKWTQVPDPELPGLHSHDRYPGEVYDQIVLGDDWTCHGGLVTDLHWWGNYELALTGGEQRGSGIAGFRVSFHEPDLQDTCLPGAEVYRYLLPFSTTLEQATGIINSEGSMVYLYEIVLPQPFEQIEGERYFLVITAVSVDPRDPPRWRWQEAGRSETPVLCGAAVSTGAIPAWNWSTILWPGSPNRYTDLAFEVTSHEFEIDYGDAPDQPYWTLFESNGARHVITPGGPFMGAIVDPEPNGQQSPDAQGDDTYDGNDDEDGVVFDDPYVPGDTEAILTVYFDSVPSPGYIDAWIDFNNDGVWSDPAEKVVNSGGPIMATGFAKFQFTVPAGSVRGATFARIRCSSTGGLAPWGFAQDGEVEDYEIRINQLPTADANGPYFVEEGSPFTLDGIGSSDPDGSIIAWDWDLDNDGAYDDASGPHPSWTYYDDGPYPVRLRVTDDSGETDTAVTSATVRNMPPAIRTASVTDVQETKSTTLSGTFHDPGTLDTFVFYVDWGDGSPVEIFNYGAGTTSFSETHPYVDDDPSGTPSDGYTVSFTLDDDDGGTDFGSLGLTVYNVDPALLSVAATPCDEGGDSTLSGQIDDPCPLDTFMLRVNWGDGSPIEDFPYAAGSTSFSETHTYADSGTPTISLEIEDDDTGFDSDSLVVVVRNVPPTADANGPYSGFVGDNISLDGTGSSDPGNDIVSYDWDLDDDGVFDDASGPTPTYPAAAPGTFTIGLEVVDADGASDIDHAQVRVDPLPAVELCPKWNQPPDCYAGLDIEAWDGPKPGTPGARWVADDWLCDGRPLVGLDWYGSYIGWSDGDPYPETKPPDPPNRPSAFRVAWYTDVPATTPPSFSHPGELIEERVYPLADFGFSEEVPGVVIERNWCVVSFEKMGVERFEHEYEYHLVFEPGAEFNEKAGTVYWISVQAIYDDPGATDAFPWGWATTYPVNGWNDDAVFSNDLPQWVEMYFPPPGWEWIPDHPYAGESVDMAFTLLTDVCPGRCVKKSQPPDMIEGIDMYSYRVGGNPGMLRADDFVSDGRPITDIHWWGSYPGWETQTPPVPPNGVDPPTGLERPTGFDLYWYAENPADPCAPPEIILTRLFVPIELCHEVFYGTVDQYWTGELEHEYQYYVDLLDPGLERPGPWLEERDVHYWLGIQAVFDPAWDPQHHKGWGWKITPELMDCDSILHDGVVWAKAVLPDGHPREGQPFDLAFELTTTAVSDDMRMRMLDIQNGDPLTVISEGWPPCGIRILQHTVDLYDPTSWIDIMTNNLPHPVDTWLVPMDGRPRRFFRVKTVNP